MDAQLIMSIISIFVCLLLVGSSTSGSLVLDPEPVVDIEPVLTEICSENAATNGARIGRQSTILMLANYVNYSPSVPPKLSSCLEKYRQPLQELEAILEAGSNENLCNKNAVDKISKFHWHYIVASLSRKWHSGASDEALPEPLRLFFLHYTSAVTQRCTATLIGRLQAMVASDKENQLELEWLSPDKKIRNLLDQMNSLALLAPDQIVNYDSFLLLWNQINTKAQRKGVTGLINEPQIGSVKLKDPTNLWALQRQCQDELRPIYRTTVLPVMNLFELGYGRVDEQSRREVSGNRLIGNWYTITQLCELLLPLKFYRDDSLKRDDELIELVPSIDEASNSYSVELTVNSTPANPSQNCLVKLDDLLASSGSDVVKQVKTNLKNRDRLFKQFLKNMLTSMRGRLSGKLKNVFLAKKVGDASKLKTNAEDIVRDSDVDIGLLLDDEDDASARRVKREYPGRGLYGKKQKPIGSWPKEKVPRLVKAKQNAKVFFRKAYVRLLGIGMMFIGICIAVVEFIWR